MKLDREFIENNTEKIKNTIYAKCIDDLHFQFNLCSIMCYKSIIYKFSLKNNEILLVKDFAKVDIDKSIIYEEEEIPIKEYYGNFEVVGDLYALINYIEN